MATHVPHLARCLVVVFASSCLLCLACVSSRVCAMSHMSVSCLVITWPCCICKSVLSHVLSNQLVGSSSLAGTCALPLLLTRACAYRPCKYTRPRVCCALKCQSGPNVHKCVRHNCPCSLNLLLLSMFTKSCCCCPTYVMFAPCMFCVLGRFDLQC